MDAGLHQQTHRLLQRVFFFLFLFLFFFKKKASCIISGINNPPRLWDCPGALRGSSVRLSLLLPARTCDSTPVKRRRLAPPPLLFHNIRDKVTVCCGLRTLITRQENNVEGKAFHHHQRSVNPPRTQQASQVASLRWPDAEFGWRRLNKSA